MPYLVRVTKAKAAHIWTGTDTACTQWSTGGIKAKHKFIVTEEKPPRLSVCQMCQSNQSAQDRIVRWLNDQGLLFRRDKTMIKDSKSVLGGINPSKVMSEFENELNPAEDDCWAAIQRDPKLARARAKLSVHELRLIIKHARDGFMPQTSALSPRAMQDRS